MNVASSLLQFVVMPAVLRFLTAGKADGANSEQGEGVAEAGKILLVGPIVAVLLLTYGAFQPSLTLAALTFGAQKTIEYR